MFLFPLRSFFLQFNGMVDYLSLSLLLSERNQVEPSLEAGNKETEAHSTSDCSHTVWIRLQQSLKYFLEYSITILSPSHNSSSLVSVLCAKKPKSHPRHSKKFIHVDLMERTEVVLTVVCKKISRAMKELVCIADQDQLSAILKSLFDEVWRNELHVAVSHFESSVSWKNNTLLLTSWNFAETNFIL